MKVLVCIAAVLAICNAAHPHADIFRALMQGSPGITLTNANPRVDGSSSCVTNAIRECKDCGTVSICMPVQDSGYIEIAQVNCTAMNPKTPYCSKENGAMCAATPDDDCVPPGQVFQCPEVDGIYPDPLSCTAYYVCSDNEATIFNCPTNNVYDHATGECKLRRSSGDCVLFNCVNKEGQDVTYPKDDRIWGTCANGRAYILGRCNEYQKYDIAEKECVRTCRVVGNQPHDDDCRKYVRCAEISPGRLQSKVYSCPTNQGYDEDAKRCTKNAACLTASADQSPVEGDEPDAPEDSGNIENGNHEESSVYIISSSGNGNQNNNVSNGNDDVDGNGNGNANNGNSGNIGSGNQKESSVFIISSSGTGNENNDVSNGNDDVDGNGNGNANNGNSGNIGSGNQKESSVFIISSSGQDNQNNHVSNGDDDVDGNGNGNANNGNSGNIDSGNQKESSVFIISSSGQNNQNNHVSNGDDDVDGNGNGNANNNHSGNADSGNVEGSSPFIISSSGDGNQNNNVSNGNDDVDGNGNGNANNDHSGNTGSGNINSNQSVVDGNDDADESVIDGNNDNDPNSNDIGSSTIPNDDSALDDSSPSTENPGNAIEADRRD